MRRAGAPGQHTPGPSNCKRTRAGTGDSGGIPPALIWFARIRSDGVSIREIREIRRVHEDKASSSTSYIQQLS
jgi:hypothetical protein